MMGMKEGFGLFTGNSYMRWYMALPAFPFYLFPEGASSVNLQMFTGVLSPIQLSMVEEMVIDLPASRLLRKSGIEPTQNR